MNARAFTLFFSMFRFDHCSDCSIDRVGECYDEYLQSLMTAADSLSDDGFAETTKSVTDGHPDTLSVATSGSTMSSDSGHSVHSKIAAAAPTSYAMATDGFACFEETRTSHRDLYDLRPSRVAVKGFDYTQTAAPNVGPNPAESRVVGALRMRPMSTDCDAICIVLCIEVDNK